MIYEKEYKCYDRDGNQLPTLSRKGGVKRIIGRNIDNVSNRLGSYGMGGAGFFGLKLAKHHRYPSEWLVLTLWGADGWLLINDKWMNCGSFVYEKNKVYYPDAGDFLPDIRKELYRTFFGLTIEKFFLRNRSFKMVMDGLTLSLPPNLSLLPPYGNGDKRRWNNKIKMEDRFIISPTEYINI